ncbi:LAG1 longevity assurance 2 [Rhynchospora pubera]|uniref:LAG1 longevity assurance 2 n=1 Tax=Rhynchospora pubera TaxID=906938 RepID=A0AAV8HDU7_9POAL|nr:LAG1 longevity assurance 2 [Rhynchospora pubera]KAJ4761374.1 LAG1 longevity assurance 2 [Rhynchospora pubera]KAJ4813856.1 LAG1 longevity assurance 2 [Rhynchospora pubera]
MGMRPDVAHFSLALLFSCAFFFARFLLDRFLYQPLAARIIVIRSKTTAKTKIQPKTNGGRPTANDLQLQDNHHANKQNNKVNKIIKFSESMWKLTYYLGVQCWALLIICRQPWSLHTRLYFAAWPNQPLNFSLMLFYMCQCGFYIYSIGALVAWETRRKDFSVMMSHHIVTTFLITYSYLTRFFRIGMIILALHDTSDVFLEVAKLFKYSEREVAASVCFGLFAISWFLLRLIYFPFWIIRTSSYECVEALKDLEKFPTMFYYIFNTMLLTLLVFHMYWWKLIFNMILKQMSNKGQVGEDVRSDSEDD